MKTVVAFAALLVGCNAPSAKEVPRQVPVASVGATDGSGGVGAGGGTATAGAKRALDVACETQVRELSTWADSLVAEGEFEANVSRGKDFYAKTPVAPGWLSSGPFVELTNDHLAINGSSVGAATTPRAAVEVELRAKLADHHSLMQKVGNTAVVPVALIVRRDTSWSRIADTTEMLESAGERSVAFVVEARASAITPPPHSALTHTMLRFARGDVPFDDPLMKQMLERPTMPEIEHCPEARALANELGSQMMNHRAKAELLTRELPRRIAACDCAVDMAGVRTRLWAVLQRFEAHPVAELALPLAKNGALLKAKPADTWQDTVESVRTASAAGKPVRFVAR
jgi:hypothetical protein